MGSSFVVENEAASDEGAHIKTSVIGASVTLRFNGTGVRFYTKKGNGAGFLSCREEIQTENTGEKGGYAARSSHIA